MKKHVVLRGIAVVFALLTTLAAGSIRSSAQQICGSNNSGPLGNNNQYIFLGDQWNSSFTSVNQCLQVTNSTAPPPTSLSGTAAGPSSNYVSGYFNNTTDTPSDYPDFLYGSFQGNSTSNTQLPMAVTNITGSSPKYNVLSGENVVEPSGYNNDMAYDIWFNTYAGTPTGQNTTGTELMIWVQHNGSAGTISGGPTYSFTDPTTGQNWTAYTGTNSGNCGGCSGTGSQVISFVRNNSDGPTPSGGLTEALNLDDFFTEALNVGQIQSSWYLTAVEFGTEIWVGGPGLQVNNFWVNVVPNGPQTQITSVAPGYGVAGSSFTLTGTNFGSTTGTVNFGSATAAVTSWSATSIAATVPSGAVPGNNTVNIVTSAGVTSNTENFSVTADPISIDVGGPASGNWIADSFYSGGTASTATAAISTSLLSAPIPPQVVLQDQRWGAMTYTIPGFAPNSIHAVDLYFAETYWTAAGDREFNVTINGVQELTNFDIFKTAGGENIAVDEKFPNITASSAGVITIAFAVGAADNPTVSGIAIDQNPTLSVTLAGAGSGTVVSSPAGISCGTTCSATFATGTAVTLAATPASGSTFTGWSPSSVCSGTGPCAITMNQAQSVTAIFSTTSLSVAKAGSGSGTVTSSPAGISCGTTCSSNFSSGTVVTLTETPGSGSSFSGWSGACSGTATTCSVTMSGAEPVTAIFASLTMPLTVVKMGNGTGTVTSSPAGVNCGSTCSYSFTTGSAVTLTAVAGSGSAFTGWSGACSGTGSCVVTMSAAASVNATFTLPTQPLYINAGGAAASPYVADEDFSGGATASYTNAVNTTLLTGAVPPQAVLQSERYCASCTLTYTIPGYTVGSSHTVTLYFVENYFTAPNQRQFNVIVGSTQVLTNFDVYAAAGGQFIAVQKAFTTAANSSGNIVIQFTMGAYNNPEVNGIAIDAATPSTYALTVSDLGTGTGTVTSSPSGINCGSACSTSFAAGSSVTLTAAAASGSTFAGWSGAGCSGTSTCVVTISAAESVTATFNGPAPTSLLIDAGGAASGSWAADEDFSGGTAATYTNSVDTSMLPAPTPPQTVLQSQRYGAFTYTIPGYTAGSTHTVSLYFVENYVTGAGQREFNVVLNGTQVLTNFDVYATAGAQFRAVQQSFTTTANSSGQLVIQFATGAVQSPMVSGIAIDQVETNLGFYAGTAATGSFVPDADFVAGGTLSSYTNAVGTSKLSAPAPPQAVLQSQRWCAGCSFTYTMPGYIAGSTHTVSFYFVENYVTGAGQREFNALLNGTQVLTNFDVYAAAGGQFNAVQENFTTTANSKGQIVIQFNPGAVQNPMVSAITVQ
jgi:hypothetical protein